MYRCFCKFQNSDPLVFSSITTRNIKQIQKHRFDQNFTQTLYFKNTHYLFVFLVDLAAFAGGFVLDPLNLVCVVGWLDRCERPVNPPLTTGVCWWLRSRGREKDCCTTVSTVLHISQVYVVMGLWNVQA